CDRRHVVVTKCRGRRGIAWTVPRNVRFVRHPEGVPVRSSAAVLPALITTRRYGNMPLWKDPHALHSLDGRGLQRLAGARTDPGRADQRPARSGWPDHAP